MEKMKQAVLTEYGTVNRDTSIPTSLSYVSSLIYSDCTEQSYQLYNHIGFRKKKAVI